MIHEISRAKKVLFVFKDANGNRKVVSVKGVYVTNAAKEDGNRTMTPVTNIPTK